MATEQHQAFTDITPASMNHRPGIAATVRAGSMEADIYSGADAETIGVVLRQMNYAQ